MGGLTSSGGSSREKLGAGGIVGIPQHPLLHRAELVLQPPAAQELWAKRDLQVFQAVFVKKGIKMRGV